MTKDELRQEAFGWTEKNISVGISMYNPSIEMYCAKAYEDSAGPREKRIEELEKENTELKLFKQNCIKLTEDNIVMARQRADTSKQLTKAKELLRMVIDSYNHKERFSFEKDLMKAEQFLQEVSE